MLSESQARAATSKLARCCWPSALEKSLSERRMKSRSCVCFVTALYAASGDILRALAAEAVCTAANIILVRRRMIA